MILPLPSEKISQRRTPKDHTSLWLVYTLSKMLSGAIHFKGSRAWGNIKRKSHKHQGHRPLNLTIMWVVQNKQKELTVSYQQMEMDNKPGSCVVSEDVVHCLFWRSRGLCICLWPDRSHRSSQCCFLTGECSGLPGLCGYTADTHIHHNSACVQVCICLVLFSDVI